MEKKEKEEKLSKLQLLSYYPKIKNVDTYVLWLKKIDLQVSKKITLILTRFCNKNCPHCLAKIDKKIENFDFDRFENILKQFKKQQVENLVISGWEPFVHFEKFWKIFSLIKKYWFKIDSIKTNLFKADLENYTDKFLLFVKWKEDLFIHGIEPSFDFYHSKKQEFNKLKKVIDINFHIIKNSSFEEKGFMNISIMRSNFDLDFEQVKNLLNFLSTSYKIKLYSFDSNKFFVEKENILNYIKNNIQTDYFLIELENDNWKKLKLRIWLNDIYKIWKAENISSNLIEKNVENSNTLDLQRYAQIQIHWVDINGNVYLEEFSTYTWNFSIWNVFENSLNDIKKEKQTDIVLYELTYYWLKRLLPKLLVLYPELRWFKYTIYDDIWQKILTLPEINKVLHILSVWLNR